MRGGKGPRNYSTGKWNTRPQRGESLKGFFFSSISMSPPLQFENPPTQRLTTPAPRDRTALEQLCESQLQHITSSSHHEQPVPSHFSKWQHRKRTSRCESALLLRIPPTCTLLQVACRQKRQAPLISRHTSPPPTSSSNWFSSPPPHWRKAKRTVSGAKNRAGVGVPLLAGLHLRQPSTTSSHLVGLEMRCTNTCCGRENGSDGESHPTAGGRMDGWMERSGAELPWLLRMHALRNATQRNATVDADADGCVSSTNLSSWRWIRGLFLLLSVPTSIFIPPP